MHSIEITDDQYDRIRALREELADRHADRYTSVTLPDGVAYLLDLAENVDDPDRTAEIASGAVDTGGADGTDAIDGSHGTEPTDRARSFPREALEVELTERNRRHTDPESASRMDLYEIAAEYEVSGRSSMTKEELVTAIVETIERRYTDPLAPVDVDVSGLSPEDEGRADDEQAADDDEQATHDDEQEKHDDESADSDSDDGAADSDSDDGSADSDGQLNAMLSLLETHDDKWRSADGDARYEVDLPDGSVEAARTKDDVRAVLFKHY